MSGELLQWNAIAALFLIGLAMLIKPQSVGLMMIGMAMSLAVIKGLLFVGWLPL